MAELRPSVEEAERIEKALRAIAPAGTSESPKPRRRNKARARKS
jgi:hypothetical protein